MDSVEVHINRVLVFRAGGFQLLNLANQVTGQHGAGDNADDNEVAHQYQEPVAERFLFEPEFHISLPGK